MVCKTKKSRVLVKVKNRLRGREVLESGQVWMKTQVS